MNATLDLAGFYVLLAQTPRDWYLTKSGMIRRKERYPGGGVDCQCPVSAVDKSPLHFAWPASTRLGLSVTNTAEIMFAADDMAGDPNIRTELLRACGLETSQQAR
jgi:hypothetical protein